jgi:hypothetical protein
VVGVVVGLIVLLGIAGGVVWWRRSHRTDKSPAGDAAPGEDDPALSPRALPLLNMQGLHVHAHGNARSSEESRSGLSREESVSGVASMSDIRTFTVRPQGQYPEFEDAAVEIDE